MKLVVALTLLCCAISYAVAQQDACCTPDQWEGQIAGINRERGLRFFQFVSYDFSNQRMRIDFYADVNSQNYQGTFIERYDLGEFYYIDSNGNCKGQEVHGILDQMCVPDGAQDTYSFTLGGSLPCTSYVFSDFVNMSDFTVTSDNCIPISGQFFTRTPRNSNFTWEGDLNFWDITPGIRNPNVFNVPGNCK